jgi:hypothetical protein
MSYVLVNEQEERRKNELRDRFAFEAYKHFVTLMPPRKPDELAEKCGEYADTMMSRLYPIPHNACTGCGKTAYLIRCVSESPNRAGHFCHGCYEERKAKYGS